ncbi:MAG: hypothetical protein ACOCUA_03415 [archaeon]
MTPPAFGYDRFDDATCPECGRRDLIERRPSQPTPWYWTCPDCRDDAVIPSPMTVDRALESARHVLIDDPRLYAESGLPGIVEPFVERYRAWRWECWAAEREQMRRDDLLGQVTLSKFVDDENERGADA